MKCRQIIYDAKHAYRLGVRKFPLADLKDKGFKVYNIEKIPQQDRFICEVGDRVTSAHYVYFLPYPCWDFNNKKRGN